MKSLLLNKVKPTDLGILRITIFGIWLVIILFVPLVNYSFLPKEIFSPLGIYQLVFSGKNLIAFFLSFPFLLFLKISIIIGCVLCILGLRPFKWFAIPTVILIFLSDGIIKGFNDFVNHAEMAILYGALILSISPSADRLSILGDKKEVYQNTSYLYPVLLFAVIVLTAYSFVGIFRLMHGGIEIFNSNALLTHLLVNSSEYTKYGMEFGLEVASNPILLNTFKIGFFIITAMEVLSLLILFNRTFAYIWLSIMFPFHLLSFLTMNIFFWENLILLILYFIYIKIRLPETRSLFN